MDNYSIMFMDLPQMLHLLIHSPTSRHFPRKSPPFVQRAYSRIVSLLVSQVHVLVIIQNYFIMIFRSLPMNIL